MRSTRTACGCSAVATGVAQADWSVGLTAPAQLPVARDAPWLTVAVTPADVVPPALMLTAPVFTTIVPVNGLPPARSV